MLDVGWELLVTYEVIGYLLFFKRYLDDFCHTRISVEIQMVDYLVVSWKYVLNVQTTVWKLKPSKTWSWMIWWWHWYLSDVALRYIGIHSAGLCFVLFLASRMFSHAKNCQLFGTSHMGTVLFHSIQSIQGPKQCQSTDIKNLYVKYVKGIGLGFMIIIPKRRKSLFPRKLLITVRIDVLTYCLHSFL